MMAFMGKRIILFIGEVRSILAAVLLLAFVLPLLAGCAAGRAGSSAVGLFGGDRISIVCTAFPQYDWVRNIIDGNEERFSLVLLMENGGDLHNFQPSALDIARVSACDLFIYVGGESDGWVEDAMKETVNPGMRAINMMEVVEGRLNLVEEEHVGAAENHGGESGHGASHGHGTADGGHAYDEHVWLSLRNAVVLAECITDELSELDGAGADLYRKNCDAYVAKLNALDEEFAQAAAEGSTDTLLFADRFPFRYFVEDYGLHYYAAFDGCSAETEASFRTVAFLINKLDELGLGFVLVTDGSDDRLAQVVIENTRTGGQRIERLYSLQSVSGKDAEKGLTYLAAMENNLAVLRRVLM